MELRLGALPAPRAEAFPPDVERLLQQRLRPIESPALDLGPPQLHRRQGDVGVAGGPGLAKGVERRLLQPGRFVELALIPQQGPQRQPGGGGRRMIGAERLVTYRERLREERLGLLGPAALLLENTELRLDARGVRVLRAAQSGLDVERPAEAGLGLVVVLLVAQNRAEVRQRDGRERVLLPDHLGEQLHEPAEHRLGGSIVALVLEHGGEIVQADDGVRVLLALVATPEVEHVAVDPLRLVVAPQALQNGGQRVQALDGVRVVVAEQLSIERHRLADGAFGLHEPALLPQQRGQVAKRAGDVGVVRPERATADRQGLAVQRLGLCEPPPLPQHEREVVERCRDLRAVRGEDAAADRQSLTDGGLGLLQLPAGAQRRGQVVDRLRQTGADLSGAVPTLVERLAQEARGVRLPESAGETRQEGDDDDRAGGRAGAVTSEEPARTIGGRVTAGPDRQPSQIAIDVLRQRRRRRVPALRLLAQRRQNDGVQIASEQAPEPVEGGAAGRRGLIPIDHPGRRGGRRLQEGALDLRRASRRDRVWPPPREQLVQHQPQRVHVRRRRGRLAPDLLRRGILWRHHPLARASQAAGGRPPLLGQQARDAEVQKLHLTAAGHQDVRRLEVAVDDQTPVGVLHRVADGPEPTQALHDGRTPRVAVLDQGMSLDVLQDEERASVVRGPAVDQTGDARVLQARQDLPLAQETRQDLVGVEAPLEYLERRPLLE